VIAPSSGLSWPVIMRNSVVLPAPFGPIHADDAAGRQLEGEIVDQQIAAKTLLQAFEIDDVVTEPLRDRDDDLRGRGLPLARLLEQVVIALVARLGFRLAGFGRGRDPFLFARKRTLARFVLAAFLGQTLLLLYQPGRIVALVGDALAAIEFEDPAGDVVEESSGHG